MCSSRVVGTLAGSPRTLYSPQSGEPPSHAIRFTSEGLMRPHHAGRPPRGPIRGSGREGLEVLLTLAVLDACGRRGNSEGEDLGRKGQWLQHGHILPPGCVSPRTRGPSSRWALSRDVTQPRSHPRHPQADMGAQPPTSLPDPVLLTAGRLESGRLTPPCSLI